MKRTITLAFIAISAIGFSQEYNFKPLWKKGDVKQITISQVEKEFENGILITDTTIYNEARVKVLKDNKDHYTIEVLYENQALRAAMVFYDKIGEELKDYKNLKLIYSVNKETAESELLNWEEAQKFMNNSFELITSLLEEKAPEFASFTGLVFLPLKETFKSKENIEGYMETHIGYLMIPYNKNFKIGETITKIDTGESPFNPMQEISTTTLLTLESVDEATKSCIIKQEVKLDLTEFIEMMKGIMQKMAESFGANDSITAKKSKEMDEFEMDIQNIQVITFDYENSWVSRVINSAIVTGTEPRDGTKTRKEVISTIIVN